MQGKIIGGLIGAIIGGPLGAGVGAFLGACADEDDVVAKLPQGIWLFTKAQKPHKTILKAKKKENMSNVEIIPATDPHLRKFGVDEAFVQFMKQYAAENPNKPGEEVSYTPLQLYFVIKSLSMVPAMARQTFDGYAPDMRENANQLPENIKDQFLKVLKATEALLK